MGHEGDTGRPALEQDVVIRVPLALLRETGITAATVKVYAAIRSRCGFEPAADNFMRAWPSVTTIARDAGIARASALRGIEWLEQRDYLLVERRPNRSSVYLLIVWREWFLGLIRQSGRAAAWEQLESRIDELADKSRSGQAEATAGVRKADRFKRNTSRARPTARKSQGSDRHAESTAGGIAADTGGYQGCDRPGSRDDTGVVSGMRPRTVDQDLGSKNRDQKNRGAAGAALVSAVSLLKGKSNGNSPPTAALMKMPESERLTDAQREKRIAELRKQTEGWSS